MLGHWIVTPLFFMWLYRYRRTFYPYIRNAFLAANGIALIIYIVYPVAPPRLLTDMGFVDTLSGSRRSICTPASSRGGSTPMRRCRRCTSGTRS